MVEKRTSESVVASFHLNGCEPKQQEELEWIALSTLAEINNNRCLVRTRFKTSKIPLEIHYVIFHLFVRLNVAFARKDKTSPK